MSRFKRTHRLAVLFGLLLAIPGTAPSALAASSSPPLTPHAGPTTVISSSCGFFENCLSVCLDQVVTYGDLGPACSDLMAMELDVVLRQLPSDCSGLDRPVTVSNQTLTYCLYALQALQTAGGLNSLAGTTAELVTATASSAAAPWTQYAVGLVRPNVSGSLYLQAYLLSKGDALSVLAATRMVNRYTAKTPSTSTSYSKSVTDQVSGNWAGYIADVSNTGREVDEVHAEFTAPPLKGCTSNTGRCNTNLGEWLGVGGEHYSKNLAQVGVRMDTSQAFFEFAPDPPFFIDQLYAGPNDEMYGVVSLDHDTNAWYVDIQDMVSGSYYSDEYGGPDGCYYLPGSGTCTYPPEPDKSTGEWIVEIHSVGIPNFDPVLFKGAQWVERDGSTRPIDSDVESALLKDHIDVGSGDQPFYPGNIGSDHTSFPAGYSTGAGG